LLQVVLDRVPEETLQRSVIIVEQTRLRIASLPVRPDLGE